MSKLGAFNCDRKNKIMSNTKKLDGVDPVDNRPSTE